MAWISAGLLDNSPHASRFRIAMATLQRQRQGFSLSYYRGAHEVIAGTTRHRDGSVASKVIENDG